MGWGEESLERSKQGRYSTNPACSGVLSQRKANPPCPPFAKGGDPVSGDLRVRAEFLSDKTPPQAGFVADQANLPVATFLAPVEKVLPRLVGEKKQEGKRDQQQPDVGADGRAGE